MKYFINNVKGEKTKFQKLQGVRLTFVKKTFFLLKKTFVLLSWKHIS